GRDQAQQPPHRRAARRARPCAASRHQISQSAERGFRALPEEGRGDRAALSEIGRKGANDHGAHSSKLLMKRSSSSSDSGQRSLTEPSAILICQNTSIAAAGKVPRSFIAGTTSS